MLRLNKLILLFIVCISLGCLYLHPFRRDSLKQDPISKIISKIPKDDQLVLDKFFQDLIFRSPFGYVLFGNKPISTLHYVNPASDFYVLFRVEPENLKLRQGIECWKKYYKLFPSKDFLFLFFGDPLIDDYIEITLVNKKKYIEVIQKNLPKFQKVFSSNITPEKMLDKISSEEDFWENNFDYEMLGILFGYGEFNSNLFQRRHDISPDMYKGRFTLKKPIRIPRDGYATVEEEYADLKARLRSLEDDHPLDNGYMDIPGFLAIPDSKETIRIKNELAKQRKKIIKLFRNGSFFYKAICKYMGMEEDEIKI